MRDRRAVRGAAGMVDLNEGLRRPSAYKGEYQVTSPPAVVGDRVVVGSAVADPALPPLTKPHHLKVLQARPDIRSTASWSSGLKIKTLHPHF